MKRAVIMLLALACIVALLASCAGSRRGRHVHTVGTLEAVAPTCTKSGLTEGQYCTVCSKIIKEQTELAPAGHAYFMKSCTVCGAKQTESVGLSYIENANGSGFTLTGVGECTEKYILVPEKHEDKPVTAIESNAFINSSIETITLSDSVTEIGSTAFSGCNFLESVYISKSVAVIGEKAFVGCTRLSDIVVANENAAFCGTGKCIIDIAAKQLRFGCANSVIPEDGSVQVIGDYAFQNNIMLKSIRLPECITEIGACAFKDCGSLETIYIPAGVTIIGEEAFGYCPDLVINCAVLACPDGWEPTWSSTAKVVWGYSG